MNIGKPLLTSLGVKNYADDYETVSYTHLDLYKRQGITVHTGRLDQEAMQNLIKEHDVRLLIDASPVSYTHLWL